MTTALVTGAGLPPKSSASRSCDSMSPTLPASRPRRPGLPRNTARWTSWSTTPGSPCRPSRIKINATDPGWCATSANGGRGFKTAEQGAAIAVRLATLGADGPTGGFFGDEGPLPW
jgi:hypothetical protein